MTKTGRYSLYVQVTGYQETRSGVAKPVERNQGKLFVLFFAVIVPDHIMKRLIGRTIIRHPAVVLDEHPVSALPLRTPFQAVFRLLDLQFVQVKRKKVKDGYCAVRSPCFRDFTDLCAIHDGYGFRYL